MPKPKSRNVTSGATKRYDFKLSKMGQTVKGMVGELVAMVGGAGQGSGAGDGSAKKTAGKKPAVAHLGRAAVGSHKPAAGVDKAESLPVGDSGDMKEF